jgi:Recombinase
LTDTILADEDGIYDPSAFNDRLLLGLKGTMSEAELHILRARLNGGIRNKAARGELRRGLPVGLVWGDDDGEVRLDPDEAVATAIRTVFDRFTELGSVRRVWLWFRSEELLFPFRRIPGEAIKWVKPTYLSIHHVLSNPVYAGAYTYGKTRRERYLDATGRVQIWWTTPSCMSTTYNSPSAFSPKELILIGWKPSSLRVHWPPGWRCSANTPPVHRSPNR